MPYSQFQSIAEVQEQFGLLLDVTLDCGGVPPVEPSALLSDTLKQNTPLALGGGGNEKSRSEFLVAPILSEVWNRSNRTVSVFSGAEFNLDPARGLNGACDFILSLSGDLTTVRAPVLMVVQAKRDDLDRAAGPCAAELVAAQRFNAARDTTRPVWGAATTGSVWRFLRIEGSTLSVEYREYYIGNLPQLLGILLHIVGAPVTPPTTGESRS